MAMRTTVVGNYPRIGDGFEEQLLRRAIARFERGEIDAVGLQRAERETVRAVLAEQIAAGIDIVTDGQVSWYDSQSHIARRLASVEINGLVRYFDTNTYYRQPVIRGPVAREDPILVDEWKFAQAESTRPVKAVLTGPVTLAALSLDRHYLDPRALTLDLANALAEETASLVAAGAMHIQIDEPILTARPKDAALAVEALDRIAARKGEATLTLFTYFGDIANIYGDLQASAADLLGVDLVQGAKTWTTIAREGSEKPLVLGVIDARNTKREEPVQVAAKVLALEGKVDLAASYLSPSNGLEFLPRDRAREKLRILVASARKVEVAE